ncbi:MAG: hypothetical protein D6694_12710 [Gammaproteobacteria bacterium]|nr:MAG: hypothetical protein D6694_12710 [Gammaproteobacteria bacterium]
MMLHTLVEKFLLSYKGVYAPATVKWYENRLKPLLKTLGEKNIEEITIDDLRMLYVKMAEQTQTYTEHPHAGRKPTEKGYSKYSLHAFVRAWKRLFKWAVEEGHLKISPAAHLQKPRLPQPNPKVISRDDVINLQNAALKFSTHPERDYAIIRFLASTNARVGGVARLQLTDLDIEHRIARVREKGKGGNGKVRPVFFDEETADALKAWLEIRDRDDNLVFGIGTAGIYQMLKRLSKKARLTGPYNPHAFRHGFAKGVLEQGANLAQVSQMMGHSTPTVTVEYYGQFATRELQEFYDRYCWLKNTSSKTDADKQP